MMRSLWSGVSGLNAHQIAMDVEADNIANVNTAGFKYSRTNFASLLSQTMKAATAPQGDLGGKNSMQIGLGTTVSTIETIFKQGSIQNTDKNTDMAINGEGFFIVSPDGGKTRYYTRAGDFNFDANGNFVDPAGNIVQGWMIDPQTGIKNDQLVGIQINPGMTTPAKATSTIHLKANLNSGDTIQEKDPTRSTLNPYDDINYLYDMNGKKIKLEFEADQFTIPIDINRDGIIDTTKEIFTFTYGESKSDTDMKFKTLQDLIDDINYLIKSNDTTNTLSASEYALYINGNGQLVDPLNLLKTEDSHFFLKIADNQTKEIFQDFFHQLDGASKYSTSLKFNPNVFIGADDVGELFDVNGNAFNLKDGQGIVVNIDGLGENRKFVYTSTPINGGTACGGADGSYRDDNPIKSDSLEGFHWLYDSNGNDAFLNVGSKVTIQYSTDTGGTITDTFFYGKDFTTIEDLCCVLNTRFQDLGINDNVYFEDGKIKETNDKITQITFDDTTGSTPLDALNNLNAIFDPLEAGGLETNTIYKKDVYYFHDIEDLVNLWKIAVADAKDTLNNPNGDNIDAAVFLQDGKITLKNTGLQSFNVNVTGYPANGEDNTLFTDSFTTMNGIVAPNSILNSLQMNAAVHTTTIDVYDSLGSKHPITIHFRKAHTATSTTDYTTWKWWAEVPEPASLTQPSYGEVKFNPDGSVNSYTPTNLVLNPNNGAEPNQLIALDWGSNSSLDGLTSFESPSVTTGQSQDGYTGGDLKDLVVDQSGTIIGVFTNGRSYPLAKVALAKFANNAGLMKKGNTLFAESPNSGEAVIGEAGQGGLGSITPSALEMSNVDLSRSLTELIVIQRGFQANSKTITTSDQMIQTLLQLKQ